MSSGLTLDSRGYRLAPVPGGGPIDGQRIGVSPGALPAQGPAAGLPALLTIGAGADPVHAAVRLVGVRQVPEGVLAVDGEFAAVLGLADAGAQDGWRLDVRPAEPVRRIRLEAPVEGALDDAVRVLSAAGLAGRLLWLPPEPDADCWLEVGGLPYRVLHIDANGRRGVVAEIGQASEVELLAPGGRCGVDIVVLADCSGSMGVDDIPQLGEGPASRGASGRGGRAQRQRRDAALREALHYLLDMRLQISGRISRLALVNFTTVTNQVFPRGGGMAELDAGAGRAAADEFRSAISLLLPVNAGTDIGNALHEAANLLYRYGKPGNEKLVVLVSDGAHWVPKGDQGSGEVVFVREEPVSLMEHLHRDAGIRLHAIGISTPALYQQWLRDGNSGGTMLEPNHALLKQLVQVGGGDAAAIGGFDVLAEYFSGLGAGVSRRVPVRAAAAAGSVPRETVDALETLGRLGSRSGTEERARLREFGDRLSEAVGVCNIEARRVFGAVLFNSGNVSSAVERSVRPEGEAVDDSEFVRDVTSAFRAARIANVPRGVQTTLDDLEAMLRDLRSRLAASDEPGAVRWRLEPLERLTHLLEALARHLSQLPNMTVAPNATATLPMTDGAGYTGGMRSGSSADGPEPTYVDSGASVGASALRYRGDG